MASGELSTEQVLLLENLMYMGNKSPFTEVSTAFDSVGDWINSIDVSRLSEYTENDSFITAEDWGNIITAVKNDSTLMNMSIAATHSEAGVGGSAVFINKESGEAVVAFRGTGSHEWKDNFIGGGPTGASDGVSTPQQESALDWYQKVYDECGLDSYSVTVTGHSKGGNKAKYIAIMDNTVDRCISYDGQGFSDEFMEKYADKIAERQNCISNHNVDHDYVNFLLNDVGDTTFYKGYGLGEGGFLENHCPNTFLNFDENGGFTLDVAPGGQAAEIKALNEFLNSYLRSLPSDKRAKALELVGTMVEGGFNGQGIDFYKQLLLDDENQEIVSYLAAYFVQYEREHPEMAESIKSVLSDMGMEDAGKIVDAVEDFLSEEKWKEILDEKGFGWLSGIITLENVLFAVDSLKGLVPDDFWQSICDWIKDNTGINLTVDELLKLLNVTGKISKHMKRIDIVDNNGGDIKIKSKDVTVGGTTSFSIDREAILSCKNDIERYSSSLENILQRFNTIKTNVDVKGIKESVSMEMMSIKLVLHRNQLDEMADALYAISNRYMYVDGNLAKN